MKIAVLGLGYVGTVTAACLAGRGHEVTGVDVDPAKVAAVGAGRSPVVEPGLDDMVRGAVTSGLLRAEREVGPAVRGAELSLVCVGTPSAVSGGTDLQYIRRVVREVGEALRGFDHPHTLVVRSTVPPGTVEQVVTPELAAASGRRVGGSLGVAMCPEFLREGSGVEDFFHPPFLVVGGAARAAGVVLDAFGFLDCPRHVVAVPVAEGLKYGCNAFHALKVAFTNELARLYRAVGVDAREVMEIFVEDRVLNISPAYLRPGFAFGGSCLPKDVRSLLHMGRLNATDLPVLQGVLMSNDGVVRDVAERVLRRVEEIGTDRRVALLGLSFKPQTDDLRESPNVALAEFLIGKGLDVAIHDPVVNPATLTGANLRHVQARLPHLHRALHADPRTAVAGASVVVVATPDAASRRAVLGAAPPAVFDLHGRLGPEIEALGGYEGVGW